MSHNRPIPLRSHPFGFAVHDLIPLQQLRAGQKAAIGQLMGGPDDVHRLEELGLRTGTVVEMVQTGVPCIIRVGGSKLCFRDCEVFRILVSLPITAGEVA